MIASEQWTRPIVQGALRSLVRGAVVPRSPFIAEEVIAEAVQRAYDLGRLRGVMELRTCPELAIEFGVDRATIFRWAIERRASKDLIALKNMLGHGNVEVTMKYLRALGVEYGTTGQYGTPDEWL
jgi:hypothetical protein